MEQFPIVAISTHKKRGIGTYLRCAVALGCRQLFLVGSKEFGTHGAHGSQNHIQIIHFYDWDSCQLECRIRGYRMIGISPISLSSESASHSLPIESFQFTSSVVFVVGEKSGLDESMSSVCDQLVHVSMPDSSIERRVEYDSKLAICLHYYMSSNFQVETKHQEEKFCVGEGTKLKVETKFFAKEPSSSGTNPSDFESDSLLGLRLIDIEET